MILWTSLLSEKPLAIVETTIIVTIKKNDVERLKGAREVHSIPMVGLCLRRILSRKIFIASFITFLIITCQFSSSAIAESILCSCGRPLSKIQTTLVYTNQNEEKYCCPHCGFSALKGKKEQVKKVQVSCYSSGKLLNAEETYFVEGYFTKSPCCDGTWIPFGKYQGAKQFIFKNGGRIVDLQGKMILERYPVPLQNNVWVYIGVAVICIAAYLLITKKWQEKRRKLKKVIAFSLVFIITASLITALALTWKPKNFGHRVLRLSLDKDGKHTVAGELEEIVLKQSGSGRDFDIGFHFFNIIMGESPKDVHISVLNPSDVGYTYCALDGEKFDRSTDTRLGLGFAHSFNIDILLKAHQKEYMGGIVFSDQRTGEVYATMPVYIIQEGTRIKFIEGEYRGGHQHE
jgi:hypothetical protein